MVVNLEKSWNIVFIKYCMKDNNWIKGKKKYNNNKNKF